LLRQRVQRRLQHGQFLHGGRTLLAVVGHGVCRELSDRHFGVLQRVQRHVGVGQRGCVWEKARWKVLVPTNRVGLVNATTWNGLQHRRPSHEDIAVEGHFLGRRPSQRPLLATVVSFIVTRRRPRPTNRYAETFVGIVRVVVGVVDVIVVTVVVVVAFAPPVFVVVVEAVVIAGTGRRIAFFPAVLFVALLIRRWRRT